MADETWPTGVVFERRPFDPTRPVLLVGLDGAGPIRAARSALARLYPRDHSAMVVLPDERIVHRTLGEIVAAEEPLAAVHIPPVTLLTDTPSFEGLRFLIARLRGPGGCPWDREQTHETLKPHLIEEAYEVLEALDGGDPGKLGEELGDLLLQVVLHAQLATEYGEFTIEDVVNGIATKIIRRHPHVFGTVSLRDAEAVLQHWHEIKQKEKGAPESLLASVPKAMPALAYAQKIQGRAARVGFDWPSIEGPLDKVREELEELRTADDAAGKLHEFGDLLFALVNVARWMGVEAEEALRLSNQRFRERFAYIERRAAERGLKLDKLGLDEMDILWEEAKTTH